MIIGIFTLESITKCYHGQILTLTMSRDAVITPVKKDGEKGPDFRVLAIGSDHRNMEIGAAWKRKSDKGQEFLSVVLDDPAMDRSLNAALFTDEDGSAQLVWSRQAKKKKAE